MPCLEWSAEEVEWEQGSGPKGPMSCRTQGWISIRPEKAYLRPLGQFSMIFNGNLAFFLISHQFFHVIQWELHIFFHFSSIFHVFQWEFCIFFIFLSIFHVIQWEICIFLLFWKFSMLFNGEFAFGHFSMGIWELRSFRGGRMDGRTDVRKFTPVSYRTSALWGRCPKTI